MKIRIEIEFSPEEARQFMGLANVEEANIDRANIDKANAERGKGKGVDEKEANAEEDDEVEASDIHVDVMAKAIKSAGNSEQLHQYAQKLAPIGQVGLKIFQTFVDGASDNARKDAKDWGKREFEEKSGEEQNEQQCQEQDDASADTGSNQDMSAKQDSAPKHNVDNSENAEQSQI